MDATTNLSISVRLDGVHALGDGGAKARPYIVLLFAARLTNESFFDVGHSRHLASIWSAIWTSTTRTGSEGKQICREESNKACSIVDAASWLQLADDFERLAERERAPSARFTECQNPGMEV